MVLVVSEKSREQIVAREQATRSGLELVPTLIRDSGQKAVESYLCFFAGLDSRHTGYVFRAATKRFFLWADEARITLDSLRTGHVNDFFSNATWKPSTTQFYFRSLKRLFSHLEADRIIDRNPFIGAETPKAEGKRSLRKLKEFLKELDGYVEGDDCYEPGLVAMYPLVIGGMDVKRIALHTGVDLADVETYAKRLRENGIWHEDGKIEATFDPDDVEIATFVVEMVLIIGCAAGVFRRTSDDRIFPAEECKNEQPLAETDSATSVKMDFSGDNLNVRD
jgi:hypothetical protein